MLMCVCGPILNFPSYVNVFAHMAPSFLCSVKATPANFPTHLFLPTFTPHGALPSLYVPNAQSWCLPSVCPNLQLFQHLSLVPFIILFHVPHPLLLEPL